MARDDDRDAVVAIRASDSANGGWLTDRARNAGVGGRRADWNSLKLGPHAILDQACEAES
jgi:hypothetical protein